MLTADRGLRFIVTIRSDRFNESRGHTRHDQKRSSVGVYTKLGNALTDNEHV